MPALTRKLCGQFPGERLQRFFQALHLVTAGVHEIDVFGKRLSKRFRHCLCASVGNQLTSDFCFDFLFELFDAAFEFIFFKALFELRQVLLRRVLIGLHQLLEHVV